jgi:hypothetical protein
MNGKPAYPIRPHEDSPLRAARPAIERYRELFPPTCQARGCTDDAEQDEMFCKRHQLVDAF